MNWIDPQIDIWIPDGTSLEPALRRTTHLAIGAHPDDLEIFAYHGIAACYDHPDRWFTGITVTDGGGSVQAGARAGTSRGALVERRREEQRQAATIGRYGLQVQLGLTSDAIKSRKQRKAITADLAEILEICKPDVVYLHNPFDKHATHVAVFARCLAALKKAAGALSLSAVYGCEVWRDLDWLPDDLKIPLPTDCYPHLAQALVGIFDSQIRGGKRYDLAVQGRRTAHATFSQSHQADSATGLTWALDLMPLLDSKAPPLKTWAADILQRFKLEVDAHLDRYS